MVLLNQILLSCFSWFSTAEGQGFSNFLQALGVLAGGVAFVWKNVILPKSQKKELEIIGIETKTLEMLPNHLAFEVSPMSVNDAYSRHTIKTKNKMATKKKPAVKSVKKKVIKKVVPKKSAEKNQSSTEPPKKSEAKKQIQNRDTKT